MIHHVDFDNQHHTAHKQCYSGKYGCDWPVWESISETHCEWCKKFDDLDSLEFTDRTNVFTSD